MAWIALDGNHLAALIARDQPAVADRVVEQIRLVDVDDHQVGPQHR